MNVPIWILVAGVACLPTLGFLVCAVLTTARFGDLADNEAECTMWENAWQHADAAHTRCSDALETARNRIERALTVETPKAAHGVRKMARLLRGEEA